MAKYKITKKIVLISILLVLLTGIGLFISEKRGLTNFIKTKPSNEQEIKSTSTAPSAQSDFVAEASTKQAGDTRTEIDSSAGVSDLNGNTSNSTSPVIKSNTGEISVFSPSPNSNIKGSATVSGTSTLNKVSYRLIDNVSGVVASGELNVVNGKYAGSISFSSTAREARLDLFGTRQDGVEFSNIEIPLKVTP